VNLIAKDPLHKKLEITNWVILAIIFIPSLIFAPFKFALGILLGGFISILNFHWLDRSLRDVFKNIGGNIKGPVMVKYYLRLAITAVVLYFLIARETVDVIGLVIGLSVVVINIIFTVITALAKKNFIEETS
jgi:MFS superfamily sulfate permease-like transporter